MTTRRQMLTSLVAGAVLVGGGVLVSAQAMAGTGPAAFTTSTASTTSADVTAALRFAREEERMARDLYAAFADRYGDAMPFAMITRSEQHHFDLVGTLLDRYGVADPSADRKPGSYADPTVQKLYDQWLKQGEASRTAAYDVGVALEQRDIADLEHTLATIDRADVRKAFSALLAASRHHLAAFQAAADGRVWSGPDGSGSGMGMGGHGMRQGMGYGMGRGGDQADSGNGFRDCPMADALTS